MPVTFKIGDDCTDGSDIKAGEVQKGPNPVWKSSVELLVTYVAGAVDDLG